MFTMCDCASLITQKNRLNRGFCGKMSRLNQTSGMWQPCGGIRSWESEANTPRGIWIQKSTFQVVPRLHWLVSLSDADISLSSLCLIFHLRPRTTDCSQAQSIRHEGSFQPRHFSRKPPFTHKCHLLHKRLPMKFLFPPLLFGPLSRNIMACFSQISLVFEIKGLTNGLWCAEDISPTVAESSFKWTGYFLSSLTG